MTQKELSVGSHFVAKTVETAIKNRTRSVSGLLALAVDSTLQITNLDSQYKGMFSC